jgi:biopolymer transport protein ExbD
MLTIKTRRSDHFVLTIALTLAIMLSPARSNAQQLRQGISVHLPPASGPASMPDADNENAWIVTITADGSLYFGIKRVSPASLVEEMKIHPRNRDQKLYLKADARAPYASVEKALTAARVDFFQDSVLLTSQSSEPGSSEPGTMVSPQGIEVLLVPPAGSRSAEVQLINSGQQTPILKINNRQIPLANLPNMLTQIFQNQTQKVVQLKADGQLSFADVVHAIDACHSAGAQVVLPTPQL